MGIDLEPHACSVKTEETDCKIQECNDDDSSAIVARFLNRVFAQPLFTGNDILLIVNTMAPSHALIIKQPWADQILNGHKTWEIRSSSTKRRGRICVAVSGTKCLYGEVTVTGCRRVGKRDRETGQLLEWGESSDFIAHNWQKHRIEDLTQAQYPKMFAWTLADPTKYEEPVPYSHTTGCVRWINLGNPGPAVKPTLALKVKKRPAKPKGNS